MLEVENFILVYGLPRETLSTDHSLPTDHRPQAAEAEAHAKGWWDGIVGGCVAIVAYSAVARWTVLGRKTLADEDDNEQKSWCKFLSWLCRAFLLLGR